MYTRRNRRSNSFGRDRIFFSCIAPFPVEKIIFVHREARNHFIRVEGEKRESSRIDRITIKPVRKGTPINSYRYSVEGERGLLSHDVESVSFCMNRRFDETPHFPMNFQGYRSINREIYHGIYLESVGYG